MAVVYRPVDREMVLLLFVVSLVSLVGWLGERVRLSLVSYSSRL